MTEADIQCLKENVDKAVAIETTYGECLIAKIIFVFDQEDQPDVFYDLVSTNKPGFKQGASYALRFEDIVSVKPTEA